MQFNEKIDISDMVKCAGNLEMLPYTMKTYRLTICELIQEWLFCVRIHNISIPNISIML